jgi:nickel/cobalt transporter (NiCoT) family protein
VGFFALLLAAVMLGLRHGADPDHLAAIDNLTRNTAREHPSASRFVGTLFASGHTIMILAIALLLGAVGQRTVIGPGLERVGTWLSVFVLVLMAAINVRRLISSKDAAPVGLRSRMLSPLFDRHGILVALPVGFLFGLGFETSSQIAAYVVIASGGIGSALAIGAAFCAGMILTDTFDSVLVSRFVRTGRGLAARRAWLWTVTLIALGVAVYETLQLAGWNVPLSELAVSGVLVAACVIVFAYVALRSRFSPPLRETVL